MFKKVIKKQQKIDIDKETKFVHKIVPPSNESSDKEPLSSTIQQQSALQKGGGRNNLQEIISILQKPMQFQIINNSKQGSASITNQNGNKSAVSRKGSTQSSQISTQIRPSSCSQTITIAENEIETYVEQCIDDGMKHLTSSSIKEAILSLRNAEVLIDTYMAEDGRVSIHLMLAVVINLGICFYKAGLFDEAYSCFENSDMRIKREYQQNDPDIWNFTEAAQLLKNKKLRLQLNLQMCILFSEVGKHEDALDYAKKSAKLSTDVILESLCSCYTILIITNTQNFELTPAFIQKTIERVQKSITHFEANQNAKLQRKRAQSEYGQQNQVQGMHSSTQNKLAQSKMVCRTQESPSPAFSKPRSTSTKNEKRINSKANPQGNNGLESIIAAVKDLLEKSQQQNRQSKSNQEGPASIYIYKEEDAELAMKTLPVLHYIAQSFLSLKGKLSQRIESKLKIASSLRTTLEEILIAKSSQDTKRNVLKAILSPSQLNMHFITNNVNEQHWLLSSNILNLLQMKPVSLESIAAPRTFLKEIDPDDTLRKIVETAICFYCISTETRFVEESLISSSHSPNCFSLSDSQSLDIPPIFSS